MLEVSGSKVVLREFTRKHLESESYFRWLRDVDVAIGIYRMEYLLPITFESVEAYVNSLHASGRDCFFAVHETQGGEFIGTQRIGHIDWRSGTADVGVMIGDRHFWGKGYATDAVRTGCKYAFNVLGLRRLTGGTAASNVAMQRCFEKLGFKEEGRQRNQLLVRGQYEDHMLYGLHAAELITG